MYAIVIGAGEVGFHLTRVLAAEGHDVVVVDNSTIALERVAENLDVQTILADAVSTEVLDQTEAERADIFLAVTSADEANLLCAAAAKQFGAATTVARVGNRISSGSQLVYRDVLGVDLLLSSELLTAAEIAKLVLTPGAVDVETFAQGKVQLRQLRVSESSKVAGKAIHEVDLPPKSLIASLSRDGEVIIPGGDDLLRVGTDAIVIGESDALEQIEKLFGREQQGARRVVLFGGGSIGFLTAQRLESHGLDVRLIERDAARCAWLAENLQGSQVLHGDGTDLALLKEVRPAGVDFFIGATGDDESNLLTGLLAKDLGATRTIALVDRANYSSLYERLGINHAISPRSLMADHILRFIRRGNVVSTAFLLGEQAEALELVASDKSKLVGKPLRRLKLPRGSLIGALVRDNEVTIPRGDDQIEAGDTVVVFSLVDVRQKIEKLL